MLIPDREVLLQRSAMRPLPYSRSLLDMVACEVGSKIMNCWEVSNRMTIMIELKNPFVSH